jgi:two-component system, OmpR family, alkaline phosphatase synthesis response regulator PhoP
MSDGQRPVEPPSSAKPGGDEPDDDTLINVSSLKTFTHVPRVLIVEDTVELGEVIQATLQRMHVMAFCETHGLQALKRYEEIQPDLVLLDIGLPDMTGWKVLDAMKESKAIFKRPAIVVITAYGDPANRLMGKLQGVDSYLIKPFTPNEVETVVREVLGRDHKGS